MTGTHSPAVQAVNAVKPEAGHSPLSSVEMWNSWNFTSAPRIHLLVAGQDSWICTVIVVTCITLPSNVKPH